jgi:hypothetical protein
VTLTRMTDTLAWNITSSDVHFEKSRHIGGSFVLMVVGHSGIEPETSVLSGLRSNLLS